MGHKKLYIAGIFLSLLLISLASLSSADAWGDIEDKIINVICSFKSIFAQTAVGVAALIMVMSGVQWIGSENDPGARKKAKTSMIHAIVGLIIIFLANELAGIILPVTCPVASAAVPPT